MAGGVGDPVDPVAARVAALEVAGELLVRAAPVVAEVLGRAADDQRSAFVAVGASPRHTARDVISAVTASTASTEGSTAATMLRPVR